MVARPLRISMIAPPWLEIPPPAYGGIELMLDALCVALQRAGHDVTLFTIGDSRCPVPRRSLFEHADPDRVGMAVLELRHVAAAYDAFHDVDIVHDHTLTGLFYSERFPDLPVVATCHGPFDTDLNDLYGRVAGRIHVIAISNHQAREAPPTVPIARVIPHGIDLDRYPAAQDPGEHLLFLGRMSADKGVDIAIRLAKTIGIPLLIAAKMREPREFRYFRDVVEPMLDDTVHYALTLGKIEEELVARALRTGDDRGIGVRDPDRELRSRSGARDRRRRRDRIPVRR